MFGKNGKRGLIGYTKLVLKEFLSYKEFSFSVLIDGQEQQRKSFIIALANSSQFGNNARVAPHASVCDEWMDVSFIKKVPIAQAVGFGQKMFTGNLNKSAFVDIIKAKKVELKFSHPMPYHIDGEPHEPEEKFEINIQPGTLRMLIPSQSERKL
jgi:diacylglycerol kinase family enzyme